MNYYTEIKHKLINNENYSIIKEYSKERYKVKTYFEIGKLLYEAGKHYGEGILKSYALRLTKELGKGYTFTSLSRMKKYYLLVEKLATLSQQLTYGHYVELLPLKNIDEIKYYIMITEEKTLSIRELRQKIKSNEYKRLSEITKKKIVTEEKITIHDFIKNPIVIKSQNNNLLVTEKDLQNIILEDIPTFLEELGNYFCFIKNEFKIKIGDRYNYIDLLLYNIEYKCYVIIELKVTELKKEHIGQIEVYMNYIDNNLKTINEDKTIGIIICKKDNHFIMEYCSDPRIISREYTLKN